MWPQQVLRQATSFSPKPDCEDISEFSQLFFFEVTNRLPTCFNLQIYNVVFANRLQNTFRNFAQKIRA